MAKKRTRNSPVFDGQFEEPVSITASLFRPVENFLHRLFSRSPGESLANLSLTDWVIYIGILLVVLVMPFLYSRATTENFLTPKEFFSKIAIAILAGIYCVRIFTRRKITLARTSLDFPLVLFFGFAAFSVLWNYNAPSAVRDLRGVFCILLLFPLVANVVRSRWQVELILWAVIFTGIATSMIGIMETYNFYFKFDTQNLVRYVKDEVLSGKIDPQGFYLPLFPQLANKNYSMGSVVSTFGNRNYLGTFAMFTAFLPLAFFFYYRHWAMKLISLGLYGWMLYGLYITRCRAALIGIAFGIVYMVIMLFLNDRNQKLMRKNAAFFVIAVGLIFAGLFVVSVKTISSVSIFDKIRDTFTLDRKISNTYERMWVWQGTIDAFRSLSGWFIGRGFGSYKHFFPYQEAETFSDGNQETFTAVTFRQAHNDWLQVISELGIIGMLLLLFIVYRFFGSIQQALRREIHARPDGEMNGDHILLIGIGAAMVAQLLAAIPDFPFHRIETAVYAVLFMGLIPVLTETDFFTSTLERKPVNINQAFGTTLAFVALAGSLSAAYYEHRCWRADEMVREADMYMRYPQAEAVSRAKSLLLEASRLDPLPGDPYLKLASIYEQEKDPERALFYANKSLQNINYNARSTYHSTVFRKMHIYYHMLNKLPEAYDMALQGLELTAGDARSMYYMYAGKIAHDITRYPIPDNRREELILQAEKYLTRALVYPAFALQAKASLAAVKAGLLKWEDALLYAASVSAQVEDRDPTMLNIIGIAASNLGKQQQAEDALKKALVLQPDNMVYHRDLGVVYLRSKNLKLARNHLEKTALSAASPSEIREHAVGLVASITETEVNLSRSLIDSGKILEAMPLLTSLAESKMVGTNTRDWAENLLVRYNHLPAEVEPLPAEVEP
ncbi:MAG: O-antigen ligase family protein, partial [Candidatus Riflebacteria bacterium]|nr:O-antigen ligase family protein [Candidatus Riflebacteria bacterium]